MQPPTTQGKLSTKHLHDQDAAKAARELSDNIYLMLHAGLFEQAHSALNLLIQPGAWLAPKHSHAEKAVYVLSRLVHHLVGQAMPEFRQLTPLSLDSVRRQAQSHARDVLNLLMVSPARDKAAGLDWTESYLRGLADIPDEKGRNKAYKKFKEDARYILFKRTLDAGITSIPGLSSASGMDSVAAKMLESVMGDRIREYWQFNISEAALVIPTRSIAQAAIEFMQRTGTPPDHDVYEILFGALTLFLQEHDNEATVSTLKTLQSHESWSASLTQALCWQPLADFYRTQLWASVSGLTAEAADRYLKLLAERKEPPSSAPAQRDEQPSKGAKKAQAQAPKVKHPLSTRYLAHAKLDLAGGELVFNAMRMLFAGHFSQACTALSLLTEPGPWKAAFRESDALTMIYPQPFAVACHLAERPFPGVADIDAEDRDGLAKWAKKQATEILEGMGNSGWGQIQNAGAGWSQDYFDNLLKIEYPREQNIACSKFYNEANAVLRNRIRPADPGTNKELEDAQVLLREANSRLGEDALPVENMMMGLIQDAFAPASISGPAQSYSVEFLQQKILDCLHKTNIRTSEAKRALEAAAVLQLRAGREQDAAVAMGEVLHHLVTADDHLRLSYMTTPYLRLALWPPFAEMLRKGLLAEVAGVDEKAANAYLEKLKERPAPIAKPAKAAKPRNKLATACSLETLRDALAPTLLAGREIADLPVLDTSEHAFAIAIELDEMEDAWNAARQLVDTTQRWPILITQWWDSSEAGGLEEQLHEEDPFTRSELEGESELDDVSPRALIAQAEVADPASLISDGMEQKIESSTLDEILDYELDNTGSACDSVPDETELKKARLNGEPISNCYQLDRWLLGWEQQHHSSLDVASVRMEWFEPDNAILLFLPTSSSWETLAYITFFGSASEIEKYIAMGKQWEEKYGAEMVAHFGTMLHCSVKHPPLTVDDAWQLAVEHDIYAPDTFGRSGIPLRHYAMGLIGHDRWFLHSRP